jgi:hypothetical protein
LAVVTGPDVPPPDDGVCCQSSWPVAALSPVQTPAVVTAPPGSVHGMKLLLALAL